MPRGLVVLGSYDQTERDIEAHFYFPYKGIKWVRGTLETSWYKKPSESNPLGRPAMSITQVVKRHIPDEWSVRDWWKWAPKENGLPFVKLYPQTENIQKTLIKADLSSNQLRFTYPIKVVRNRGIKAGERRNVWIPVPKYTKVLKAAKSVLIGWLNDGADYMIPPLARGDWDTEETRGIGSIGVQRNGVGENINLKSNQFALRVYDYDMGRVARSSNFAYDTNWQEFDDKIDRVIDLANRNTVSPEHTFKSQPNRTTSVGGFV